MLEGRYGSWRVVNAPNPGAGDNILGASPTQARSGCWRPGRTTTAISG
jgi:hypothetical protein